MTQLAKCSRCDRALVQILHGHFKNGRQAEDFRCAAHAVAGPATAIGGRHVFVPTGSTYQLDRIEATEPAPEPEPAPAVSREYPATLTGTARVLVTAQGIHVLDPDLRTFMAKNRAGDRWHLIQPATSDMWVVREGYLNVGELTCTCESGRVRGWCYRTRQVEAYEAEQEQEHRWDPPVRELAGATA